MCGLTACAPNPIQKETNMTKKTRRWLKVDGKVNTLTAHLAEAGCLGQYQNTLAKRHKCKPSEIPLNILSEVLQADVTIAEQPDNWQEIMYGHPKGGAATGEKKKHFRERVMRRRFRTTSDSNETPVMVRKFLNMVLSSKPLKDVSYY